MSTMQSTPHPPLVDASALTKPRTELIAQVVFALLCAETIFSIPYRTIFPMLQSPLLSWIAALCCCAVVALCYLRRDSILRPLRLFAAATTSPRHWFLLCWIVGLLVRLAWALKFPIALKSDGLAYFNMAKSLTEQHLYPGSFWPPGLPLFLTPFFLVLGAHLWVTVLCSLLLFTATYWITARFAQQLHSDQHLHSDQPARIACLLVALWPTQVAATGINSKETLLAFFVTASLYLYFRSTQAQGLARWTLLLPAGMLIGGAALTQPGYILFPAVIFLAELLQRTSLVPALLRTALLSLATLLAILPWTYRNYRLYHRPVLISTNGGSVFYRANNPKANAGYSAQGEEALPADTFAADEEGYRAAKLWIRQHPGDFTALMVRKQVLYLGDDSTGVYESLKRDLNPSPAFYALAKLFCNFFWLACWVVLLLGLPALFPPRRWPLWYGLFILPLIYQWAIESVFESGGRHHLPYLALVSILIGIVLSPIPSPPEPLPHTTSHPA